jgi:acetolactate synthase-1/3 small subunit
VLLEVRAHRPPGSCSEGNSPPSAHAHHLTNQTNPKQQQQQPRRPAAVAARPIAAATSRRAHRLPSAAAKDTPTPTTTPTPAADVYLAEPEPLKPDERKHIVSIFVADESGLINRVAGVFARRGANIESLAVGLSGARALFTVVVAGTDNTVSNLVKQLGKLVKVRYVEDITFAPRVERELLLVKLAVPPGPARLEALELAEVFRARVVDVGCGTSADGEDVSGSLVLCVSGDPGKTAAFQRVLSRFGVVEVARTGRISLKRGEALLHGSSDALMAQAQAQAAAQGLQAGGEGTIVSSPAMVPAPPRPRSGGAIPPPPGSRSPDVYAFDSIDADGVWSVSNVLEPADYESGAGSAAGVAAGGSSTSTTNNATPTSAAAAGAAASPFSAHTLSVTVSDLPGVLQEVTLVFARRGYNIQSLAVGPAETPGDSRITMVVPGSEGGVATLLKHVRKLVNVKDVTDITSVPYVARELMLVKVRAFPSQRGEIRDLVQIFRASVIDVSRTTLTVEITGREDKMRAAVELLEPYGVLEIARTGRVALKRESGVDTAFLETVRATPRAR